MVIVIYHDIEIIWIILVTFHFLYTICDNEKYYPGEPVDIYIKELINIIQEKNGQLPQKKGLGKIAVIL